MPHPKKLSDADVTTGLQGLTGWTRAGDELRREFQFEDFVTAWTFMSGCALVAERMNHHPEWFNVYGTVKVELSTHDAGGISANDFELAKAMNGIAAPLLA